jgi:hypothetical protein
MDTKMAPTPLIKKAQKCHLGPIVKIQKTKKLSKRCIDGE